MTTSVIILAPLGEPLKRYARSAAAVHAFEFVEALASDALVRQRLKITVAAAPGSTISLPLIELDIGEFSALGPGDAASPWLEAYLWNEFHLSGALDGYDLVHSLALLSAPLQERAHAGSASVFFAGNRAARALAGAFHAGNAPIESRRLDDWTGIAAGCHPVDLQYFAFPAHRGTRLCVAQDAEVPASVRRRADAVTIQSVHEIAELAPQFLVGPASTEPFVHFVWAIRALAVGARYVHSGRIFDSGDWPRFALRRHDPSRASRLNDILEAPGLSDESCEALRRWVLGYCTPAAAAAATRRLYDRAIASSRSGNTQLRSDMIGSRFRKAARR